MSVIKNTVLLLKAEKPEAGPDNYETLLTAHNFKVIQVKTLTFEYKNLENLQEKLLKPEYFSGLILTSPRCVNATSRALGKAQIQELWKAKMNFVVGERTYEQAVQKLGLECLGKESGNAKNISQAIIQEKLLYTKPFLLPHGNLKTDTLKMELGKENLNIDRVLVYDTIPNPDIENELSDATNSFMEIPEFVVFFSPSGVRSSITCLRRFPVGLDVVKFVAIGPVTETAIKEENLQIHQVAKSPTPEEVLKAITNIL